MCRHGISGYSVLESMRFHLVVPMILASLPVITSAQALPDIQSAQVLPQVPIPFPPAPPPLPERPPPAPPPPLLPPAPQPPAPPEELPSPRVFVREIRLVGNTVFSDQELAEVTDRYTNRELTPADVESLRLALTHFYVSRGYVTSGAVVPDQTVTDGVITIQIIEGKLSQIEVEGVRGRCGFPGNLVELSDCIWFRPSYFRDRIALSAGPPLNREALQERIQLLLLDPRIQRLNVELRPGISRGESVLNVKVTEANPFKLWLEFNNFQSPTVGAAQGLITGAHQNLFGFGDTLSLQYGRTEGINPILNFRYAIPVSVRDTTVSVQYRRFDFKVVEDPFEALDITNDAEIFGFAVRHPLYRTLAKEFALMLIFDYETNKSFLLGEPFEFIPGATNGVFRVSALRFAQEWVHRTGEQVFSAVSRFSLGLDVFGATVTSDPNVASARFFSWLGEAQWIRQLKPWRMQLVSRGVVQLSNDHLFPLEQIAVGGRYSVRGYREFTQVRDNAVLGSVEVRIPVYTTAAGIERVFLAPFVDVGHGWDTTVPTPTPPPQTLASVGIGAIWNFWRGSHFEIYWGQQLNHFRPFTGDLQDLGIHLQLVVEAF